MPLDNYEEDGNRPACAACRHQRKKCRADCILWRHFPAARMEDFQAVHKVFGISNISKMIKKLDPVQQDLAVESFLWEAKLWVEDPVEGPLGRFNKLEQEVCFLRNQINTLQRRPLITAPSPIRPETYQPFGSGGGNFNFHPNYTGQHRMSNGYGLPSIQPSFGQTNLNHQNNMLTQNVREVLNPRPLQRHLPPPYHNSFGHNKENAPVNPFANFVQDHRSVIHRTSNAVRPSCSPAGPGMPLNRSSITVKHGGDQIVGHQTDENESGDNEARDLAAAIYHDHQFLLNNTNQNNVQGKLP